LSDSRSTYIFRFPPLVYTKENLSAVFPISKHQENSVCGFAGS